MNHLKKENEAYRKRQKRYVKAARLEGYEDEKELEKELVASLKVDAQLRFRIDLLKTGNPEMSKKTSDFRNGLLKEAKKNEKREEKERDR